MALGASRLQLLSGCVLLAACVAAAWPQDPSSILLMSKDAAALAAQKKVKPATPVTLLGAKLP